MENAEESLKKTRSLSAMLSKQIVKKTEELVKITEDIVLMKRQRVVDGERTFKSSRGIFELDK